MSRAAVNDADPRVRRSRQAILAAAFTAFAARGFPGCSLDDVAVDAGVAKRTIYNLYGDKESLFQAVISQAVATAQDYTSRLDAEALHDRTAGLGLQSRLDAVAVDLARSVLGTPVVALRRLLIAEQGRFPDLAVDYYRRAPGRVMDRLGVAMERLHADGELDAPDGRAAAEHFAFLVIGAGLDRAMFDPEGITLEAALARARSGARVFHRAYRVVDRRQGMVPADRPATICRG